MYDVKSSSGVVFDFYPLFILCINTQRGCHTFKKKKLYETMSISSGLYPNLDLRNANKLQLQLQHVVSLLEYNIFLN